MSAHISLSYVKIQRVSVANVLGSTEGLKMNSGNLFSGSMSTLMAGKVGTHSGNRPQTYRMSRWWHFNEQTLYDHKTV